MHNSALENQECTNSAQMITAVRRGVCDFGRTHYMPQISVDLGNSGRFWQEKLKV